MGRGILSKIKSKTKKKLDEKNNELKRNLKLLETEIQQAKSVARMHFLESFGYNCSCFESFGPIEGSMSADMEAFLNKLTKKENVLVGIHRVGQISNDGIQDILMHGLSMTGHSGSGASSKIDLATNVGYYPDNKTIIKELMYADLYKNSKGSILLEIPDQDLKEGNLYIKDTNGVIRLNPKYILGYVPVLENHRISTIITAEQLKKETLVMNSYNMYEDFVLDEKNSMGRSR